MVKKDGMILEHPSLRVRKDGMILEENHLNIIRNTPFF